MVAVCYLVFLSGFLAFFPVEATPVIHNLPNFTDLIISASDGELVFEVYVTDPTHSISVCDIDNTASGTVKSGFEVRQTASDKWGVYTKSMTSLGVSSTRYSVQVECTCTNNVTVGVLTVNMIPNTSPEITNLPYNLTLSSASTYGDIIYTVVATDTEGDDITYEDITCKPVTNPACPFQIFATGILVLTADVSTMTETGYDVSITPKDAYGSGDTKTLTVIFSGINSKPRITNLGFSIDVEENSPTNSSLVTTQCTDSDGDTLTYSMTCNPTSGSTYFRIMSSSGVIKTSTSSINFEHLNDVIGATSFECIVVCSDGEASSTATVTFSVTDVNEAPSFAQNGFSITADEEETAGTALQASGYNIIDEDDFDTKSFSLDCGSHTGYFSIASDTGITSFATRYDADDVTRLTSYSCTVTVTDSGGLTDTATLLISIENINDNTPTFTTTPSTWFLYYNAAVGTVLGTVSATDDDIGNYGKITYSLDQSSLGAQYFGIDQSGQVYVRTSTVPLGEDVTKTFDIIATDGGGLTDTVTATVVLQATTTVSTTTTTDRYRTFFEDGRNIAWFTASCIGALAVVCAGVYMCMKYTGNGAKTSSSMTSSLKFNCCKLWREYKPRARQPRQPPVEKPADPAPTADPEDPKTPDDNGAAEKRVENGTRFQFWSSGNHMFD